MSSETERLLSAWREAERRLRATSRRERRAALGDLAQAWLAYELAVGTYGPEEIVLVADDWRRYVAASPTALRYLELDAQEIAGLKIDDVTSPADRQLMRQLWMRSFGRAAPRGRTSCGGGTASRSRRRTARRRTRRSSGST